MVWSHIHPVVMVMAPWADPAAPTLAIPYYVRTVWVRGSTPRFSVVPICRVPGVLSVHTISFNISNRKHRSFQRLHLIRGPLRDQDSDPHPIATTRRMLIFCRPRWFFIISTTRYLLCWNLLYIQIIPIARSVISKTLITWQTIIFTKLPSTYWTNMIY